MARKMLVILGLVFIMVTCIGCGNKDNGNDSINNKPPTETHVDKGNTKDTPKAESVEVQPTLALKQGKDERAHPPKEEEERLGKMDEHGNWIPPKGTYIDPESGTIYNEYGTAVGSVKEPHDVRPGSQG